MCRVFAVTRRHESIVIVAGPGTAVADFRKRLRTRYVDEDSRGKKCKERMSTIAYECHTGGGNAESSFAVATVSQGEVLATVRREMSAATDLDTCDDLCRALAERIDICRS